MRYVRGLFWSLLAALSLSTAPIVAMAQDTGLQRFERDVKPQLEFEKFTYGSASALGPTGFVLNDVVAVMPASDQTGGKSSTVKVAKITVEDIDFERLKAPKDKAKGNDDMPRFAKIRLEGMTGDDDLSGMFTAYGIPRVPADVALDYRLDTERKIFTLNKFEIVLQGEGRTELGLVLDGVSDKASKLDSAKDDVRLRTSTLVYDDSGLLAKLLPAMAKQNGATADVWVAMALASIGGFANGQGPDSMKAFDALASYISDWKAPKGPLRLTLSPPKSTNLDDLAKITEPNALTDIFGLTVAYAGTRAGAAGGGAAPSVAAAPADDGQKLTGMAAWTVVVGNTLTGKEKGKAYFDYYRKDGTVASLSEGEISKGKWALEGERLCTKYPDEDKECFSVAVSGKTVTMTDAKGKGYRSEMVPGNPKDL
jgi:hypothetical protein